jgi:hypothetical protein
VTALRKANSQPFAAPHQQRFLRYENMVQRQLSEQVWRTEWSVGRDLTLAEAVQLTRAALQKLRAVVV